MLFTGKSANADDSMVITTSSQPVVDPVLPIVDGSTVTINTIQSKIYSATATLQVATQNDGNYIISSIQTNVPNTDTSTAIQIATTQEPIASAVETATAQIQIANQAIDSATVAVQIAQNTIVEVDSQTAVVLQAQLVLDTATVTVNNLQNTLAVEIAKLPDLKDTQRSTESNFYTENSNLGTATSNAEAAQNNLTNAVTDLQNNGTITVTTNGVTATVYRATNGAAPVIANPTPVEVIKLPYIAANWGNGQILNSGLSDHVIVKYEGTITVPSDAVAVKYAVSSDDGSKMYVDGVLAINNWRDQGTTWSQYSPIYDTTNDKSQDFIIWYYENGGGASCTLGWMIFRADGTGYFTTPGASAFGTSTTTVDPVKLAAADAAKANVISTQSAYNTQLAVRDAAYQAWQDAIHAVNAQQSVIDSAQAAYDNAQQNLTIANQNLTTEQQNLTIVQQNLTISLQTANSLADTATIAVQSAVTATDNAVQITNDYYAQQAAIKAAAEAQAAQAAALAAQQAAAEAQAAAQKAAADKAVADAAAAKALADQQAADAAKAKAEADALAAQQAADAKAKQDAADAKAKADQDAANAKAEADAKAAQQAAADQAAKDEQAKADAAKADQAAKDQAAKDAQAKADAAKAEADAKAKQDAIGVIPNSPDQLSDTVVKEAPAEILVPHIQQDKVGVENGGIQFFGTKSAPQVVGEDGKLTPPAPPPGSGLPIPADAITTSATFIGQPGGTTFNAPDIAVPVVLTPVTGTLAAVPGIQAVNQAFVAMANIGNDMSPVTRKKAKKILVLTIAVSAIRRRFGQ